MKQLIFHADVAPWGRGFNIYIEQERHPDATHAMVAAPLKFERIEDAGDLPEATMRISTLDALHLMDALWRAGLRPTEGSGSAGSLAATERHLSDMRKIAFGLLHDEGIQP